MQGHARDGTAHLCHTSCTLFDGGPVRDYLARVKAFLDGNPNEVITILFTNPEELSVENYSHPAFLASGLAELAFVPTNSPAEADDWPTLQSLIDSGKRVVVFMDKGTNSATVPICFPNSSISPTVSWIQPFLAGSTVSVTTQSSICTSSTIP